MEGARTVRPIGAIGNGLRLPPGCTGAGPPLCRRRRDQAEWREDVLARVVRVVEGPSRHPHPERAGHCLSTSGRRGPACQDCHMGARRLAAASMLLILLARCGRGAPTDFRYPAAGQAPVSPSPTPKPASPTAAPTTRPVPPVPLGGEASASSPHCTPYLLWTADSSSDFSPQVEFRRKSTGEGNVYTSTESVVSAGVPCRIGPAEPLY